MVNHVLIPAMLPPDPMVPMTVTVPCAVLATVVLAWYWRSFHLRSCERSRRRIRRANTLVQYALIVALVYALSVVKPASEQQRFMLAWVVVLLFITAMIVLAFADALNTLRLRRRHRAAGTTTGDPSERADT